MERLLIFVWWYCEHIYQFWSLLAKLLEPLMHRNISSAQIDTLVSIRIIWFMMSPNSDFSLFIFHLDWLPIGESEILKLPFATRCVSSRICFIKLSAPDFEACILRVTKFSWLIVCLVSVKLPFCFSHNISYTISFIIYSVGFLYLAWNIFIFIWDHFVLLNLIHIYIYITASSQFLWLLQSFYPSSAMILKYRNYAVDIGVGSGIHNFTFWLLFSKGLWDFSLMMTILILWIQGQIFKQWLEIILV